MPNSATHDMPVLRGTAYAQGQACGVLLASDLELSFWGGIDPQTGEIIDCHHPLSGQRLENTVLAIPGGRGSCSGSGVMLELLLNGKGPKAVLFERPEDILTLGVVVAEEVFGKSIPVVVLGSEGFQEIMKWDGTVHVSGCCVSRDELTSDTDEAAQTTNQDHYTTSLRLSDVDKAFLRGTHGESSRLSMQIILRMATLLGAKELMDITQVHVDGCIYTGPGSLLFAQRLRDLSGKVRVKTSLNSISIDQKRWRAHGVDSAFAEAALKLADAYTDMGARPTFTCSPYQLTGAPGFGDQVAWAESNAVVYANSVLGARTMKYPDFLDICIALTGRAPKAGPHIEINRLASVILTVVDVESARIDESFYPLLGYHAGTISLNRIPAVTGIESLRPSRDDLKAFGAAFATVSSAPMFHILGITPEATTLDAITPKDQPYSPTHQIKLTDLVKSWNELNTAPKHYPVDFISLGNPHLSLSEIRTLATLCQSRIKHDDVAMIITCGRSTYSLACQAGLVAELENFGVQFITDTCWCMITEPVIPLLSNGGGAANRGAIMTNSGKYAHYGPGLTGREFHFGSMERCVEAACQGYPVDDMPRYLLEV